METSAKKNKRVEKDAVRFGVEVTIKFEFDFKIFFYSQETYILFRVKFW